MFLRCIRLARMKLSIPFRLTSIQFSSVARENKSVSLSDFLGFLHTPEGAMFRDGIVHKHSGDEPGEEYLMSELTTQPDPHAQMDIYNLSQWVSSERDDASRND